MRGRGRQREREGGRKGAREISVNTHKNYTEKNVRSQIFVYG